MRAFIEALGGQDGLSDLRLVDIRKAAELSALLTRDAARRIAALEPARLPSSGLRGDCEVDLWLPGNPHEISLGTY
jgi:hypothetical protein